MDYWLYLATILILLPLHEGLPQPRYTHKHHGRERNQCVLPPLPDNVLYQASNDGLRLLFSCRRGYKTLGDVYSFCQYGQWSTDPPICIARGCRPVYHVTNGRVVLGHGGAVASFTCNHGYIKRGASILTCNGTHWNGSVPQCQDPRGDRGEEIGYSHREKEIQSHTDWLRKSDYSCIKRHSHITPPTIPNTQATTQWAVVDSRPRLFTTYRCQWGYISKGKVKNIYCQNGAWIGPQPKCTLLASARAVFLPGDQPDVTKMTHSDWLLMSDYSCMKSSSNSLHKTQLQSPDNGHYRLRHDVRRGFPRLYAELVCSKGYHVTGDVSNRYCRERVWIGPEPTCVMDD